MEYVNINDVAVTLGAITVIMVAMHIWAWASPVLRSSVRIGLREVGRESWTRAVMVAVWAWAFAGAFLVPTVEVGWWLWLGDATIYDPSDPEYSQPTFLGYVKTIYASGYALVTGWLAWFGIKAQVDARRDGIGIEEQAWRIRASALGQEAS